MTPAILLAADLLGVHRVFKLGGAQAIAALALGTETVPQVYKLFGAGNRFVTAAKLVASNRGLAAIDLPAGPTEVLILADETAPAAFVAADLIAQSEHAEDSAPVLITTSAALAAAVRAEIARQLAALPAQAQESVRGSFAAYGLFRYRRRSGRGYRLRQRLCAGTPGDYDRRIRRRPWPASPTPGRSSSARIRRNLPAITPPAPTMCCRRAAMPAPMAPFRSKVLAASSRSSR